jgi:hypothetical protein
MPGPRPHVKKTVQAFVTVEKWKQLRHIVTEMQRAADSPITQAVDMLDDRYPAQPGRREGRAATRARPELKMAPPMDAAARDFPEGVRFDPRFVPCGAGRAPVFDRSSPAST